MNFLTPLKNCFLNFHKYMPEQLGFETMLIIDPWGMAFHAVGVIGLTFDFLFKMVSSYCGNIKDPLLNGASISGLL